MGGFNDQDVAAPRRQLAIQPHRTWQPVVGMQSQRTKDSAYEQDGRGDALLVRCNPKVSRLYLKAIMYLNKPRSFE